jgi:hypothetical protein
MHHASEGVTNIRTHVYDNSSFTELTHKNRQERIVLMMSGAIHRQHVPWGKQYRRCATLVNDRVTERASQRD